MNSTGIEIRIPSSTASHRRAATLLAVIAHPPRSADSLALEQRIVAICRCHWAEVAATDPAWRKRPGTYVPEELEFPFEAAKDSLNETLHEFSQALGAVDVLELFFKRAIGTLLGRTAPGLARKPVRNEEIRKAISREATYRYARRGEIDAIMPPRMPKDVSDAQVRNFANRNLRPFRQVWHIIIAFDAEMHRLAREGLAGAETVEGEAFRATAQLEWWDIVRARGFADRIIGASASFERAVPLLELAHSPENEVIRLRLT